MNVIKVKRVGLKPVSEEFKREGQDCEKIYPNGIHILKQSPIKRAYPEEALNLKTEGGLTAKLEVRKMTEDFMKFKKGKVFLSLLFPISHNESEKVLNIGMFEEGEKGFKNFAFNLFEQAKKFQNPTIDQIESLGKKLFAEIKKAK